MSDLTLVIYLSEKEPVSVTVSTISQVYFLDALASLLSTGKFHSLTISENIISCLDDMNGNFWKCMERTGNDWKGLKMITNERTFWPMIEQDDQWDDLMTIERTWWPMRGLEDQWKNLMTNERTWWLIIGQDDQREDLMTNKRTWWPIRGHNDQ